MTMTPRLTKLVLTAHVTASVGWLGSVVAYLALAIAGLTSRDPQMVRAAYLSMELIGWFVVVPFSFASVLTGVAQSLGTEWGLFRHYWILAKFVLTIGATIILLVHMQTAVSRMAVIAAETLKSSADFRPQRIQLVLHAVGGLLVLLTATTLSIYRPWGMTPYGRRKQQERRNASSAPVLLERPLAAPTSSGGSNGSFPSRWVKVVGVHVVIVLVLLVVAQHVAGGGGPGRHAPPRSK